ncbi:hypothetical protein [Andreprevotia chitinilytica]|uniref:hypothetical protein n=1 Tax=Andreprevotia chitinilytica TaxID=396808 RepID=UPI00055817D3|nr:hypothetical protein [Andreprevotia chitinilytica]
MSKNKPLVACLIAVAIALALPLAGCGGGGGSSTTSSSAPSASTLSGVAATGLPIIGATVTIKDAAGTTATIQTGNDGSYTFDTKTLSTLKLPLIIKVSGGTVGGQANSVELYSVSTTGGIANITPLSHLLLASLTGQLPADFFAAIGNGASTTVVTDQNVAAAQANVLAKLQALGIDVSALKDLIKTAIKAGDATDATDQLLDKLNTKLSSVTDVATTLATDTIAKNNGKVPTNGKAPTDTLSDATYGGCMALSTLPSGLAATDLASHLPETLSLWHYTQDSFNSYGGGATRVYGTSSDSELREQEEISTSWLDETGTKTAIGLPSKKVINRQTDTVHNTVYDKPYYLLQTEYYSPVGRAYLGQSIVGSNDNPSDSFAQSNYNWNFYYNSKKGSDAALDGLAKNVGVKYSWNGYSVGSLMVKTTEPVQYTTTYQGMEQITTHLGTFNACKIAIIGTKVVDSVGSIISFTETHWDVKTLGTIRRDDTEISRPASSPTIKNYDSAASRELYGKLVGTVNYGDSLVPSDETLGSCLKTATLPALTTGSSTAADEHRQIYTTYLQQSLDATGKATWQSNRNATIMVQDTQTAGDSFYLSNGVRTTVPAKSTPYRLTVTSNTNLAGTTDTRPWYINGKLFNDVTTGAYLGWEEDGDGANPADLNVGTSYFQRVYTSINSSRPAFWNNGLRKGVAAHDISDRYTEASWITGTQATSQNMTITYTGRDTVTTPLGTFSACKLQTNTIQSRTGYTTTTGETQWLVPTLGIVRQSYSEDGNNGSYKDWHMGMVRDTTGVVRSGVLYGNI